MDFKPDHIIFSDDKLKNIKEVEKFVEELGIHFVGFRYGGRDECVKHFDPEFGDWQKAQLLNFSSSNLQEVTFINRLEGSVCYPNHGS